MEIIAAVGACAFIVMALVIVIALGDIATAIREVLKFLKEPQ